MTARLFFFLLLAARLFAQEYSHRIWRTEDGLPQNRIQAITQTKDGYLWIGTSEGLARFDGVRFVVFDRSNTSAFTDNSILSLEPAPDGSLWVGTEGGGLLHYANNAFRSFGAQDGLTNGFVRALYLDRARTLWVGTDRGFFQLSEKRFVRFDDTADIPLASVHSIAADRSGRIWAASSTGLLLVDHGRLLRAPCGDRVPSNSARIILLLREGLLDEGCGAAAVSVPDVAMSSLHRDGAGNLWVGTLGQGLIRVTGPRRIDYTAPLILPDNTVFALFEDHQHNLWAGAQNGLLRLSRTAVTAITAQQGLTDDNTFTIYKDHQDKLWVTTSTGQVYRLQGMVPERFHLPFPESAFRVRTVHEDSRGVYWFGAGGDGLVRWDRGKVTRYTRNEGLRNDYIRQIMEGAPGILWLATASGISRWDGHSFRNYYLEDGLSYPSTRCLAMEANGDILVGTDAGLNRIHEGRIVLDPLFAGLKQEKIWSILVDGSNLWLGTRGGGLVLCKNGKLTKFTARHGLVSNSIYQILDDQRGNLWMSGPTGVFSISRQELDSFANGRLPAVQAVAYGTSDGMEASQMFGGVQPAGIRGPLGDLWFPSVRGVVRIDPAYLSEHKPAPVLIENGPGPIVIPPGPGKLAIDFTAPDLVAPQQLVFRYKLEGFDETWTSTSKLRSAYYSNLSPGRYRFRVQVADSEASILVDWKPTFQQTGWFYALCTAILLCLAWTGLWLYTRQTQARFALLLAERTRVAREMHDTVIQGCIGVSTLMDAAARTRHIDSEEAGRLLDHARAQVKATLEEARQAVWDLRHYEDGLFAIDLLIDLARKVGSENGVAVDASVTGKRQAIDSGTDRALLLAGREALRNAVHHGRPSRISMTAQYGAEELMVEITDNGRGFDVETEPVEEGHFGILGMRERVEQMGGSFALRSTLGNGATVSISFPLNAKGGSANALNAGFTLPQFPGSARQSPPGSGPSRSNG